MKTFQRLSRFSHLTSIASWDMFTMMPPGGSAARGALVMLVFSLGTVPLLFLFGALQSFLPRGWMKYIVKGSAVLVVTLGLSMLVKGIRLFGM